MNNSFADCPLKPLGYVHVAGEVSIELTLPVLETRFSPRDSPISNSFLSSCYTIDNVACYLRKPVKCVICSLMRSTIGSSPLASASSNCLMRGSRVGVGRACGLCFFNLSIAFADFWAAAAASTFFTLSPIFISFASAMSSSLDRWVGLSNFILPLKWLGNYGSNVESLGSEPSDLPVNLFPSSNSFGWRGRNRTHIARAKIWRPTIRRLSSINAP
jgi:hypothetical protein